jgi:6,7-dimethyl-8-ribityllumazine synthase
MSGEGSPTGRPFDCHDLRVAVVAASWHERVMQGLLDGALEALRRHQVESPVVVGALAEHGYEAVVALGVVIRGGTPHFEYVCSAATDGLSQIAVTTGAAVGFGLLTCDTEEQALDRAGLEGSHEDKGYEVTAAALVTAMTLRKVRRGYDLDES